MGSCTSSTSNLIAPAQEAEDSAMFPWGPTVFERDFPELEGQAHVIDPEVGRCGGYEAV